MWLFTRFGFFSCVCGRDVTPIRGSKLVKEITDTSVIMIRARDEDHLNRLIGFVCERIASAEDQMGERGMGFANQRMAEAFQPEGGLKVKDSPSNDYRFRIIVPHAVFPTLLAWVAEDVTYHNFKSEVAANEGSSEYENVLHRVWSLMAEYQGKQTGFGPYGRPARVVSRFRSASDKVKHEAAFTEPMEPTFDPGEAAFQAGRAASADLDVPFDDEDDTAILPAVDLPSAEGENDGDHLDGVAVRCEH